MQCPICGHEMNDKKKRCPSCKSRPAAAAKSLAQIQAPPGKKSGFSPRKWLSLGAGVLVIALVIFAAGQFLPRFPGIPSGSTDPSGQTGTSNPALSQRAGFVHHDQHYIFSPGNFSTMTKNSELVFYSDGHTISTDIVDTSVQQITYSLDGKTTAFLTYDLRLYLIYKDSLSLIAENVNSFRLSNGGEGIVYEIVGYSSGGKNHALFLYNCRENSTTVIEEKCSFLQNYVISPDGQSVAYVTGVVVQRLILFDGKESTVMAVSGMEGGWYGGHVLAISNYGWHIYTFDHEEEVLEHLSFGELHRLSATAPYFYFNSEHTQVIFRENDYSGLAVGGEVRIWFRENIHMVMPDRTYSPEESHIQGLNTILCNTLPTKDLRNQVYITTSKRLLYVTEDQEIPIYVPQSILGYAQNPRLDRSGENLYYVRKGVLVRVHLDPFSEEPFPEQIIGPCEKEFGLSKNGERLYYLDGKELMYTETGADSSEAVKIAGNVSSRTYYALALHDRGYYYYVSDNTLYGGIFGTEPKEIAQQVSGLRQEVDGSIYVVFMDFSIYAADEFGNLQQTNMTFFLFAGSFVPLKKI